MPWPTKKLGEVLDYEQPTKYIVRSTNYKKFGSIPVLTAGKSFILGYTDEKDGIFPKDKLPVIIFDDFTTASKFVDFPFKVKSSAIKILHPKRNLVDAKYVFYKVQTIDFPVTQHKRYWISKYSQIEISLPPLSEQKRIVEKIEKLFAKIDEAEHLRAESLAASAALLPSALHQVFNRAKKGKLIKLGEVIKLQGGYAFKSREYQKAGVPIVRIQNLQNENIDLSDAPCISLNQKKELQEYLLEENDILIAMSGATTGKIAIVKKKDLPALLNQRVGRFRIRDHSKISNNFLFWVVRIIQQKIFESAYGAAQPNISGKDIEKFQIPLPPLSEQKKIVAYLDALSQKSRELQKLQQQTAADFSALRQSILAQAFKQK